MIIVVKLTVWLLETVISIIFPLWSLQCNSWTLNFISLMINIIVTTLYKVITTTSIAVSLFSNHLTVRAILFFCAAWVVEDGINVLRLPWQITHGLTKYLIIRPKPNLTFAGQTYNLPWNKSKHDPFVIFMAIQFVGIITDGSRQNFLFGGDKNIMKWNWKIKTSRYLFIY